MTSRYDKERREHQPHPGPRVPAWAVSIYRQELYRTTFNPSEPFFAYTVRMPDGRATHFAFDLGIWKWKAGNHGTWMEVFNQDGTPDVELMVRS